MEPECLKDYTRLNPDPSYCGWTRPVYRKASGPGVIIIHEIPGLHPLVVEFADRVAEAGMTVYLPSLFGEPCRPMSMIYGLQSMLNVVCVRREFDLWASDRSSPIVDWLRALARQVHEDCGGSGVGALGMCVSGNFALAMMTEEKVVAPVLSQPSLPLPLGRRRRAALGLSPQEIQCVRSRFEKEDLRVIGLRFLRDPMVPEERFATLKETFGDRFEEIKINPDEVKPRGSFSPPHSVLTIELRDDDPAGPTRKAERRVIEFFKERLGVGSPESPVPAAPAHGPGNTGIS